ncbi:hypothetical protein PV10_06296 [Exophiala mesophila]|uniref:DUF7729 domain-containing protein n=1 Tax=Exophiala mesophila TaxID=212818 RepID=A0A0D1ZY30_EXOME|nr:uncharacterized protein PV10_06296 [Exophiala mesophila]KIV91793.1 hypothetical protein PV10_06296 [Exophiala mesophila]
MAHQTTISGARSLPHRVSRSHSSTIILSLMIILVWLATSTAAFDMTFNSRENESEFFQELAQRGEIHVDRRMPSPMPTPFLQPRQDVVPVDISESQTASDVAETTTRASAATSDRPETSSADQSSSIPPTTTSGSSSRPSTTTVMTALPSAFDTSLGSNFTNPSCPKFFSTFLANATFQSCIPVSLFLQNSYSFIRVERDESLLEQTLDAACKAPLAICQPLLAGIARDLIDSRNCGSDFSRQNPLVMQAYNGLIAYEPVYRATCLKNTVTGTYCFTEAILNSTNPTEFYPYYTAIGMSLPATIQPSCTECLRNVMEVFASYAEDATQPLAKTYLPCANQVTAHCGADFARTDVQVGSLMAQNKASPSGVSISMMAFVAAISLYMGLV